ncbi:MAG: hypothetical protein AB7L13_01710 [Acidimicrobiia bacterium]
MSNKLKEPASLEIPNLVHPRAVIESIGTKYTSFVVNGPCTLMESEGINYF